MGDTITRRAGGRNYRRQLGQCVHRDETRADGQHGTRHAIRHPDGNRGRVLVSIAQPQLATRAYRAPNTHGLAVQRMPGIVNGDLLSVVGGM
ncbi:MAG TPA: hypothetical protein VES67_19980 [Vicinamibacterales bacterium]|nr:hypothetical protein [Vicinamibacterales bacterium]